MEIDFKSPRDAAPRRATAEIKRQGDHLWSVYQQPATIVFQGARTRQVIERRVVVNDKYLAVWPMKGNPIAYQHDHNSVASMGEKSSSLVEVNVPPDVTAYAYGELGSTFGQLVKSNPGVRWDVMEVAGVGGEMVYQVRRFAAEGAEPSKPDFVWVIDPRKGFLSTEMVAYKPNGDVWVRRTTDAAEVAPGIWFPTSHRMQRYDDDGAATEPSDSMTVLFKDVKVNHAIDPKRFEIEAMRLKQDLPTIVVIRTMLDGERVRYVYSGDRLVPQDLKETVDRVLHQSIASMADAAAPPGTPPGPKGTTASAPSPAVATSAPVESVWRSPLLPAAAVCVILAVIAAVRRVRRRVP